MVESRPYIYTCMYIYVYIIFFICEKYCMNQYLWLTLDKFRIRKNVTYNCKYVPRKDKNRLILHCGAH